MTAEATGVKKIVVTFNKAVDTTKAVITVKKGAATMTTTTTFAADAKSAELAMGSKLTAGTYTVTVSGLEDTLSADVVTKEETLTSFELVGKNLVASAKFTTCASISYKALNQYGEMMAPNKVNVSSTFSTSANTVNTPPTATKAGTIECKDIITTLAIPGTPGTIVIVDEQTGVNLNEQVTYQSKAVPATAEVVGIYSEKTEKLIDGNLKKGDTIANYKLMLNIKDQYGTEMSAEAAKDYVSLNPAGIITDLTTAKAFDGTETDITFDGKNNILVSFTSTESATKIQTAGTLNLTLVSSYKGVLATPSIVVDEPTVIASISVAPASALYAGQKNDLVVEAIDVNGNAVTKYDDLKAANIKIEPTVSGSVTLNKNSDGTGKFVYSINDVVDNKDSKHRNSTVGTLTVYANETTSSNYLVKSVNVVVYEKATPWEVTGTTAKTITAAASGTALTVDLSTFTYADQYGNSVKYDDIYTDDLSYYIVDKNHLFNPMTGNDKIGSVGYANDLTKGKIQLNAQSTKGSATLYVKYVNPDSQKLASEDVYDVKVTLSVVDGKALSVSDVEIASINDGKEVCAVSGVAFKGASSAAASGYTDDDVAVVVTGIVNGKKVVLDPGQYTITNPNLGGYGANTATNDKRETKTLNVVVESEDGPIAISKEYIASNKGKTVTVLKAADSTDVTGAATLTADDLKTSIKMESQYGDDMTADKYAEVLYDVTFTGDNAGDATVSYNKTQAISIALKNANTADHYATVIYKFGDLTLELSVKIAK